MFNHQSSLKQYDAIVVGSGISGLTISLIHAKEGKKVALLERDGDIAPLIRPYQRKGCECSPGLHFSGWMDDDDVIASFLRYLHIFDGVEKVLYENNFLNIHVGQDRYRLPRGFENVEQSLLSHFPECPEAVHHYFRLMREVNQGTFYFNKQLMPHFNAAHDFMGPSNFTLEGCLKKYNASQRFIDLLGTLNYALIGSKADEVPFTTHAFAIGGFYQSPGFFTISGINRLLANFKRELGNYGVEIFLHSEVETILLGSHRNVEGVRTKTGDEYFSPSIIASFNPKLLNEMVNYDALRSIYRQRLMEAENTFGFYLAFYKIEETIDFAIENMIQYDERWDNPIIITSNITNGQRILCLFLADDDRNIPAQPDERRERANERLEVLESIIDDKFPALKGKRVLLDFCKPWSFERYTKTVNGSAYGIKQTINAMGFQHKVPIRGLYLVGQAIFPGFLGSMISSFSLACELFEADKFWTRVINQ